LKRLLKIRARMSKPTIVFIDVALNSYLFNYPESNNFRREFISNRETCGYGKLYYTSCFLIK